MLAMAAEAGFVPGRRGDQHHVAVALSAALVVGDFISLVYSPAAPELAATSRPRSRCDRRQVLFQPGDQVHIALAWSAGAKRVHVLEADKRERSMSAAC